MDVASLAQLIQTPGWDLRLRTDGGATIVVPSQKIADSLIEGALDILARSAGSIGGEIFLKWGEELEYRINATMIGNSLLAAETVAINNQMLSTTPNPNDLVKSIVDVDINDLYNDPHPVYIFAHYDHTILFANKAACEAQCKTAAEMIGRDGASLDIPEELDKIISYIDSTPTAPSLLEYEFPGYRWYKDPETQIWRRKRMMFVENWHKIDFSGQPARIGKVLSAVEL